MITRKQSIVLEYLKACAASGRMPTQRDMQRHFGWKAQCVARQMLLRMEKAGVVRLLPFTKRGIQIVGEELDKWVIEVLLHTSQNGRFVTGEQRVIDLAKRGFLFDHGSQRLACGDHYLVLTTKGRDALNNWHRQQPKPKWIRRASRSFSAWQRHCDAFSRISFPQFLKVVWPEIKHAA